MHEKRIRVEFENGIADVELFRPEKRNAVDLPMFEEIADTIRHLRALDDLRCVVLSGSGEAFCAGIDLGLLNSEEVLLPKLTVRSHGEANIFQAAAWGWRTLPVPVVAAVHGVAFGAGCQIMLGTDIRIASPSARISFMETKWGLVPDMAAFPLLKGNVRDDVARELVYTARVISGAEAAQFGLVTRIADEPKMEALRLASAIASQSAEAVRAAKRLFNASMEGCTADLLIAESLEQKALIMSGGGRSTRDGSTSGRKRHSS